MTRILDLSGRGIYADLMRKFRNEGHDVYIVSPSERSLNWEVGLSETDGVHFLKVPTLDLRKVGILKKGIGQTLIERQFKKAIKECLRDVKFDLVLYSTPPVTFVAPIRFMLRKDPETNTYLLLKDIFPQNAIDIGMMSNHGIKGLIYKYFRKKEKALYKISDHIGCMSPANVDYVLKHNQEIPISKVELAPNSLDLVDLPEIDCNKIRSRYGLPTDRLVLIYGGNLGKPQGIDYLIKCLNANSLRKDCHFLIIGNGTEKEKLDKWSEDNSPENVTVLQRLPKVEYDDLVRACDVGLIFLDHRFTIPNYPSRLLSYLENRMPILAATDPNTDIGRIAETNGYGYWCESDSVDAFTRILDKMLHSDIKAMGEKGYEFMKNNYLICNTYNAIMRHFEA